MNFEKTRACPCGSGLSSWWLRDARGIECCRVCVDCEKDQRQRYRPEVMTNPHYDCDESIEPEE